jgi:hypothetical protein
MENLKKMTIAQAKEQIKNEFCSWMTKEDVLRLLDSLENCCDDGVKIQIQEFEKPIEPLVLRSTIKDKSDSNKSTDKCMTFSVHLNENILDVVKRIGPNNLPLGPCTVEIWNAADGEPVWPRQNGMLRGYPTPRRTFRQYLSSESTPGRYKYQEIDEWKNERQLAEIIVKICKV